MAQAKLISPLTRQEVQKLRVAAYCRVSSNSADQKHSYAQQVRYYTKYIQKKSDWQLVEVFADEGISGMSEIKRPEFQRMVRMCELRQIDLILTKSVSRFARNVKEALANVRKLKLLGVGVMFEKESINTLSLGDEMLLNTFAAIAQEESQAISQHIRLSITKRMELGEYVDSNAPYGYRLENKQLVIHEPEAAIVRHIYARYLSGASTHEIARELSQTHVATKTGKERWKPARVAYILSNEKYVGDSRFQKTYRETTVPFHQHTNRGQEDMFYAENTHISIIDRETFDKVQSLRQERNARFCRETELNTYPLTSRIRCSECGAFFRRKVSQGCVKWVCATHENDAKACVSYYYSEERIYDGFITMVNKLRFGEEDILGQVLAKLDAAITQYKRNCTSARELSHSIAEINAKILMLDQLHGKGYLASEIYQAQMADLRKQLSDTKNQRQDTFETKILAMKRDVKHLKSLLNEIEEPLELFDENLFTEIVKEISINADDEMTITVLGNLKFTELI